jgi:predicted nucleotidyltransferase
MIIAGSEGLQAKSPPREEDPMAGATVRSAPPVPDGMRAHIMRTLGEIETREDVRVLFACESGSRGWGFASPDSGYDVRFVYVRRLDRYLTIDPLRDVIEQPPEGTLDLHGWDLRKALQLLRDSNPTLLEWLRSPIVYRQDDAVVRRLRALAEQGFSPVRGYHHYVSTALRNLREQQQIEAVPHRMYLGVLRPLLAARWIREGRGVPPMRIAELVQALLDERAPIAEIDALLEVKSRAGESAAGPRREAVDVFIEDELRAAQAAVVADARRTDARALDRLLHDAVLEFESASTAA